MIAPKLQSGDEIRVLALSRSLGGVMQPGGLTEADVQFAVRTLESLGLRVSFGRFTSECNSHLTASPEHRLQDLHEAIQDPSVKAILAVTGGAGAIQLLDGINYELVAANPKIICGYSDIGYLCNAIFARTGLVTYYGPNFTSFMMRKGFDYTLDQFRERLFGTGGEELLPAETWSDDIWAKDQENRSFHPSQGPWVIQEGETTGTILGGAYFCFNMLQSSKFFPPLRDSVLFLESPAEGKATLISLDSGMRALSFHPDFSDVRGIVIGRFAQSGGVTRENLTSLISEIAALKHLPVLANCDFGHTTPVATLPIGGRCKLRADKNGCSIKLFDC